MSKSMFISTKGTNTILSRREIKYVVQYFAHNLMGTRLSQNLSINVESKPQIKGYWGLCWPLNYCEDIKFRDFGIILYQSKQKFRIIETIAHEMVHVKQFARGQLYQYDHRIVRWMGQKIDMEELSEVNFPWEVEANSLAKELKQTYINHLKSESLVF